MIAGGAGLALLVLGILLWRGGGGRVAIILAAAAGSAIGLAATLWAIFGDLVGVAVRLLNSLGAGL